MATAHIQKPEMLSAALGYVARGWPVFPCKPNKAPLIEGGFQNASRDPAQVAEWWRRWPDALIGIPTGSAIGLWVLDVDSVLDFEAAVTELGIVLPGTLKGMTGKGYHLYFLWDPTNPVHSTQKTVKGWPFADLPGAEVRGEGGYVIVSPSLHSTGRRYAWASEQEACEAPDELLEIIHRRSKGPATSPTASPMPPARQEPRILRSISGDNSAYGMRALQEECDAVAHAPNGTQEFTLNQASLKLGALVAGGELNQQAATSRLIAAGMGMMSHDPRNPWTPQAVATKVERGMRDGAAAPRSAPASQEPRSAVRNAADAPAPATPQTLPVQRFKDIEPQLTGLWLIKRLLPAVGQAVVHGHPNCGKSFLVMDMAFHVALGWDWHGRRTKQGLVVYIGAEGLAGLRNRVVAFRRENDIDDMPFSLIPTPVDMQAADADIGRVIATIKQEAAHYNVPIGMIVLDTLSKTFGAGKENTDDMAIYVANCGRVAAQFECCVLVVHHRPKDAESEDPRGHSSLKGGTDTVILVEAGSTKSARCIKQRDGELGPTMLFKLKPIELGEDEDGEVVTSCIVEPSAFDDRPAGDPVALAIAKLSPGYRLIFNQLAEVIEASGFAPPAEIPNSEINRLRVGKVVKTGTWREKVLMAGGTERDTNRDTAKRAFNRALTKLQTAGIVRVWGDYAWRQFGPSGHGGTDQPGHGRDTGHTGTYPLRGVPDVPDGWGEKASDEAPRYRHGNPALGYASDEEDDPAVDEIINPRRTVF